VQIDKFVRLVKKYWDFEELTTPMLNDFIEKVVIHEAEVGRTKDRTQQVDIYFNFIGNFVLPLSEDEVQALQSEEARRAEEIAERKRKSSKKSTQKRNQKRATKKKKIALAELKEQAEKGNQEVVRELEERRAIARERSRKSAEKRKQRAENDPEYAKYLEERNAEYNRRHTARRKEQMEALRARAEAGDQEAQSQLAERKQYQVRATVKSYRKMREDALNGDTIAKERYEKTLAMRREAYHSKKSEQTA
jgi:site-specific DNA recombinase